MFCSNCGKQVKDDMAFCPYCGAKLSGEEAATELLQKEPETDAAVPQEEEQPDIYHPNLYQSQPVQQSQTPVQQSQLPLHQRRLLQQEQPIQQSQQVQPSQPVQQNQPVQPEKTLIMPAQLKRTQTPPPAGRRPVPAKAGNTNTVLFIVIIVLLVLILLVAIGAYAYLSGWINLPFLDAAAG